MAKDEDKKHEEDDDKEGEEDSVGEGWEGGVQVRRGKNPRHKESRQRQGTRQTVQLRTSKIHNPQRNHDMTIMT